MTDKNLIIDFELAEDTKALLTNNEDVLCTSEGLKEKIYEMDNSVLLKVTKTIDSPIKIHSAEEVTEELIEGMQ